MLGVYKFSGLIHCSRCEAKYRGKMQRNKAVYICSTYNKDSSKCIRHVIKEEDIVLNIFKHVEIHLNKKIENDHEKYVKSINVGEKGFRIYYKDGTNESIVEFDRARY